MQRLIPRDLLVLRFAALQEQIARRDPAVALTGLSVVLVVLLGVQAARIGWALVEPVGPVGAVATSPAPGLAGTEAGLGRFDPFFRAAANAPAAPDAGAGMRLFGIRVGPKSSAIIGLPDGKQVAVMAGEEVAPGVVLRAVEADHVELLVQGRAATLAFPAAGQGGAPAYAPPPIAQPDPPPAVAALSATGAGSADLARAGLQPGDVVLSVNGQSVTDSQSVEALARELSSGREAVIQYRRDGEVRTATVRIPQQ